MEKKTQNETEKSPDLGSWDDLSGSYIKPDLVQFPYKCAVIGVEGYYDKDNKPQVSIVTEFKGKQKKIGLNKTNLSFVRSRGLVPNKLVGKTLTFEKCKTRNPSTNQMVDSFLLNNIE